MRRFSFAQRFLLGSLVILLVGMTGIGLWVARQIEDGVMHRTAATTALYVDSFIASSVQDLGTGDALSAESAHRLTWLLVETRLEQQVAGFRIWDRTGRVVYSTAPSQVGQQSPVDGKLASALRGEVTADIGTVEGGADFGGRAPRTGLLKIYSPVRGRDTGQVIGVAEFYYAADDLRREIAAAQRRSWFVVGTGTAVIYLVLAVFVQRASNTIAGQQRALADQVGRLTDLLHQNAQLHERVRGAAARTTALNERFLRRFSAELHDGPAQDISLALLQLDHVQGRVSANGLGPEARAETEHDLDLIQMSLRRALDDVRATSAGLLLPQLGGLTVAQTVDHAVRAHRRRTGSAVDVILPDLPDQAPLATKIALYRVIQEGLANAWRHARGTGQEVRAERLGGGLRVEVADAGSGFDAANLGGSEERLGLLGMRERVESLGGEFRVESEPGKGTHVIAVLPLRPTGGRDG